MNSTAASPASRWLPALQWTVYGLLAVNIVVFLLNETDTEGPVSLLAPSPSCLAPEP